MEEEETRAFIVLSDTHLGLREGFKKTVSHRPTHVDQFVKWLEELQTEGEKELPVVTEELRDDGEYELKKISSKKLSFPEKLVLNGDIFELWDGSDKSIQFASHSILSSISRLKCEKLYLIGNHDFANVELAAEEGGKVETLSNLYPWGLSELNIIRDTYPTPRKGMIRTLRVGEDHYLLLHGHQFSKLFRNAPLEILSSLRDGAEAFRLYSWVFVGSFIIWVMIWSMDSLTDYLELSISLTIQVIITLLLAVLAIPRIFVSIARPIFNLFNKSRYDRKKALKGFGAWWEKFTKKNELQAKRIYMIYGHTHAIDLVEKRELEKIGKKKIEKVDLTLINHPAWVKDTKSEHKRELREVFVYVDKYGFEFFGWSWDSKLPFHIPKSVVRTYSSGKRISNDTADLLNTLHWPKKLVEELKESGSNNPRVGT